MDAQRCSECGVPLDQVPFADCDTHRRALLDEPEGAFEEAIQDAEYELLRVTMERTGDD